MTGLPLVASIRETSSHLRALGIILRVAFLFSGGATATAFAAEPPEFIGVMANGHDVRLSLREKESGTFRWLQIGESFADYTLKAFDASTDTATLEKDGATFRVALNSAKIKEGSSGARLAPATAQSMYHNVRQIAAAANQYYLENGKAAVTLDELVGPDKIVKRLVIIAGEDYHTLTLKQGTPVILTAPSGETITADENPTAEVSYAFYPLRPGDTGVKIAQKAGITLSQLLSLNPDVNWSKLNVGQIVRVR